MAYSVLSNEILFVDLPNFRAEFICFSKLVYIFRDTLYCFYLLKCYPFYSSDSSKKFLSISPHTIPAQKRNFNQFSQGKTLAYYMFTSRCDSDFQRQNISCYESRGTLATQNINFKVCVRRFEDFRKTIAGNNRLDK